MSTTIDPSKGTPPLVSIVIPAYNVAPLISNALNSAFAQTMTDIEVIVVNDGSPDTAALEAALAPYRDRIRYVVQENAGPSAARNAGIREARGEFVAFLDADDVLLPFFLEEHLSRAADDSTADVFYGDLELFGEMAEAGHTVMEQNPSSGVVDFEGLVTQRCCPTLCSMVRRRTLLAHGAFDTSLRRSEDYDLWLRLAHNGVRFNYTRRVVAKYCIRREGLTADLVSMLEAVRTVLQKSARTMDLTPHERELLAMRMRHFEALQRLHEGKRAFVAGDHQRARAALSEANASLRSWKITLGLAGLALAPTIAVRLYDRYQRLLGRSDPVRR
jgi:glycosyltransferase involved in cell wall biosynthesis